MKNDVLNGLRNWRGWVVLGALLLFSQIALADIIPSSRLANWSNAGVPGGIPTITNIFVNVLTTSNPNFKCPANGSDISAHLYNAITSCPPNEVVFMPAGTYTISKSLPGIATLTNIVLRGAGPGLTIIVLNNNSSFLNLGNISNPQFDISDMVTVLGTAAAGAGSISVQQFNYSTVWGSTTVPSIGNLLYIDQVNGYYNAGPNEESGSQVAWQSQMSGSGTAETYIWYVNPCSGQFITNGGVAYTAGNQYPNGFPTTCANPSCAGCILTNLGNNVTNYYVFAGFETSSVVPTNAIVNVGPEGYPLWNADLSTIFNPHIPDETVAPGNRAVDQIVRITGVSMNGGVTNITFSPPLFCSFSQANQARAYLLSGPNVSQVGIESMTISNKGTAPSNSGIQFMGADRCWMTNVEFATLPNYAVQLLFCTQCEIDHCYFHDGPQFGDVAFTEKNCTALLCQNNIIANVGIPFWTEGSGIGNVVAYNYLTNPQVAKGGIWEIDASHSGAEPVMCLYEGNVLATQFLADAPTAYHTLFRNWIAGFDSVSSSIVTPVKINLAAYYYNIVGNILGIPTNAWSWVYAETTANFSDHPIYALGYPCQANNALGQSCYVNVPTNAWWAQRNSNVDATILRYDNFDYANNAIPDPVPGGTTLTNSYYTANGAAPYWWGNNLPWPPFDPNNPQNASITNIPAGYRYVYGVDPPGGGLGGSSPPGGTNSSLNNLKIFQVR